MTDFANVIHRQWPVADLQDPPEPWSTAG